METEHITVATVTSVGFDYVIESAITGRFTDPIFRILVADGTGHNPAVIIGTGYTWEAAMSWITAAVTADVVAETNPPEMIDVAMVEPGDVIHFDGATHTVGYVALASNDDAVIINEDRRVVGCVPPHTQIEIVHYGRVAIPGA